MLKAYSVNHRGARRVQFCLFIYLFIYFTNFWGLKYQNVSQWNIVTSASVSAFRAGHHVTVYPSYICPVDSFVIRALNLILTV